MDVLYADADLFVVNKPAGVAVGGGSVDSACVLRRLARSQGVEARGLFPIVSPGCDVSGVTLVARKREVRDALRAQPAEGRLSVTYLAVVRGAVPSETGVVDQPIGPLRPGARRREAAGGREPVVIDWRLRDSFVGFALLECVPRGAAGHDLRAQLAAAGLPLAVDPRHGGADRLMLSSFKAGYRRSRRRAERPLIRRPTLHAWAVGLEHPRDGRSLRFEAPLPKDLRATLHQLDRFGRMPK